jgi:hypothetical protein
VKPFSQQDKQLYFTVNLEKNNCEFPLHINSLCDKFIGLDKLVTIANADDCEGTIVNRPVQKNLLAYTDKKENNLQRDNSSDVIELNENMLAAIRELEDSNAEGSPVKKKRQRKKKEQSSNDTTNISDLLKNMKKNTGAKNTSNNRNNNNFYTTTTNGSNINKVNNNIEDYRSNELKSLNDIKFDISQFKYNEVKESSFGGGIYGNGSGLPSLAINNIVINNNNNILVNKPTENNNTTSSITATTTTNFKPSSFLMKLNNIFD